MLAVSYPSESLQDRARIIASEFNISSEHLSNLIFSESNWNPNVDNGEDRGLCQINRKFWPEITDEQAFDPEWCMRWTAQKILDGDDYLFVVCNCYALVKTKISTLPMTKDLIPNTDYPHVGGVIIMKYGERNHYVYIEKVTALGSEILESNFKPCLISRRTIEWADPHIVGYWFPEQSG